MTTLERGTNKFVLCDLQICLQGTDMSSHRKPEGCVIQAAWSRCDLDRDLSSVQKVGVKERGGFQGRATFALDTTSPLGKTALIWGVICPISLCFSWNPS